MPRPNILLIHTDQQRWDAAGCYGNAAIRTPNIDRLAAGGVRYERYHVNAPVCMPSRMSYLTGLYPSTLGVYRNGQPMPEDAPTLWRLLRPYGYTSAQLGKLHFLPHACRDHRIPHPSYGLDHGEIADEPGPYEDACRAWVRKHRPEDLDHLSVGLPPAAEQWQQMGMLPPDMPDIVHPGRNERVGIPFGGHEDSTFSAFVATRTIDYLRTRRPEGQPFVCIAGFYAPHSPWVVPQTYLDMYPPADMPIPELPEDWADRRAQRGLDDDALRAAVAGYYAAVTEVDHHVGRILDAVDEQGLAEDTIVVFTSDHGEWLGEQLQFGKGHPAHDCISHVPCIVRGPSAGLTGGRTVGEIVEAVDLVPSLLAWSGCVLPPHLQGRVLPGGPTAGPPRGSALTETNAGRVLRTDRWRYVLGFDGAESLYDCDAPLGEYRDLAGAAEHAATLSELRRQMAVRHVERFRPAERTAPY